MKTVSGTLAAHQALGTTTLAWCWKVTRTDAVVFGFTSADVDITYAGQLYQAATGFTPSNIASVSDMSVSNLEVNGLLDAASITEADLLAGRWDGAEVEIFELNYKDLTQGRMILRTGTLGNVSAGRTAFEAELRGLSQAIQQPVGAVYAAACNATLGDARCGVDLVALQVSGSVTAVTNRRAFSDSTQAQAADYFGGGVVTWVTGLNAGLRMEARDFAATAFTLSLPMPYDIALGDTFTAVPGCRKRRTEDCKTKYNNVINFRGFPDLPLNDKVIGSSGLATV